jgi:hypothetical protein
VKPGDKMKRFNRNPGGGSIKIEMKIFWKKYGIRIELAVLFLSLAAMVYYQFWNEESPRLLKNWFLFVLCLFFFVERLIKVISNYKRAE